MGKIICDVCGTSYSDSAAQCPICGYTNSEKGFENNGENGEAEYAFVKGGRFSKSNVRKRVKSAPVGDVDEYADSEDYMPQEKSGGNVGLVIIAIILLLAISAVVVFITLNFFVPNKDMTLVTENVEVTQEASTEQTTDDGIIECSKLEVSDMEISISEGGTYEISVIKEPVDTTDELVFESADTEIATVDANGVITPVKTGTTVITVTCGEQKVEITVTCQVAEQETFMLTRMELELTYEGEKWELYAGSISVADIVFSSDDTAIATIDENGVVYAVAEGETTVHGQYGDQVVDCKVVCKFDKETETEQGGVNADDDVISEDEVLTDPPAATGKKGYVIKTNFGDTYVNRSNPALFDIGQYIGYDITLRLVDGNGNRINATWKVYNTSICKLKTPGGSEFSCLAEGKAFAVATTEDGETYVCIIRVVPYPG